MSEASETPNARGETMGRTKMDDTEEAKTALANIYDDYGFEVGREMVRVIMEGLGCTDEVIALAVQGWDCDHRPSYD